MDSVAQLRAIHFEQIRPFGLGDAGRFSHAPSLSGPTVEFFNSELLPMTFGHGQLRRNSRVAALGRALVNDPAAWSKFHRRWLSGGPRPLQSRGHCIHVIVDASGVITALQRVGEWSAPLAVDRLQAVQRLGYGELTLRHFHVGADHEFGRLPRSRGHRLGSPDC